jgi:ankyrin repeat protein
MYISRSQYATSYPLDNPDVAFAAQVGLTKRKSVVQDDDAGARFREAVREGDTEAVAALLENPPEGFDINAVEDGKTALHLAVEAGADPAMFRLLVDKGRIDLALPDGSGKSAFEIAQDAAKGGDEAALGRADFLHKRMTRELARAILDGNEERAKELLEAGADPMLELDLGITGLAYAAGNGNVETVKAILALIPEDKLQDFLDRQSEPMGDTALHAAARAGDSASYDALKEAGASEEITNTAGFTALELKPSGLERRGNDRNKPNYHHNPFRLFWDVLATAAGRAYNPTYGPFADPPEDETGPSQEMDYLPPSGTTQEQAREYARRINEALDRDLGVDTYRTFEWVTELGQGQIFAHGSGANGETFMLERLRDLAMFVDTPTGRMIINSILDSGEALHLRSSEGMEGGNFMRRNPRGGYDVYLSGRPGTTSIPGNADWASAEGMPTDVIMAHELIHVSRSIRGLTDNSLFRITVPGNPPEEIVVLAEEVLTEGNGPGQYETIGTENSYRAERGGDRHPELRLPPRTFHTNPNEVGANGFWAGVDAPNAHQWWEQYRASRRGPSGTGRHGHHHNTRDLTGHGEDKKQYEAGLDELALLLARSGRDGDITTSFSDPLVARLLERLAEHVFLADPVSEEGGRAVYMSAQEALDKVREAVSERLPGLFGEEGIPGELEGRFESFWSGDAAGDALDVVEEVRDRLNNEPEGLNSSIGDGYKLIGSEEEYEELMSGEPGSRVHFSYDYEFEGLIRFHVVNDKGEVTGRGVIDKEAQPEIAGRAMYERDFMDRVREGAFDFKSLFLLRFQKGTGRPEWSPAVNRVVDDWLKTAPSTEEFDQKLWDDILGRHGGWTRADIEEIRDSGVAEGHGKLDTAITAYFYDLEAVPTKQDFENALNALASYITENMLESRYLPPIEGEAAGWLATIVKYHLQNFQAKGDDKKLTRLVQIYHLGDDYLYGDLPNIIGDRVENAFKQARRPKFEAKGAADVVKQWFGDRKGKSDAYTAMTEAITREYHGRVAWMDWLFDKQLLKYPD